MSRVITFSMKFPAYHPKAGEPTNFVEKLVNAFQEIDTPIFEIDELDLQHCPWDHMGQKWHTIRAGHRWKVGDKFSPRVWSGKPYNSKQVTIAGDITITNVWSFEIKVYQPNDLIDREHAVAFISGTPVVGHKYFKLAQNDGLTQQDLVDWFQPRGFPEFFHGQIICWSPSLEYYP